jgi:GNAT superfamily N-acetyltransferase
MIRRLSSSDFDSILAVVNNSAQIYEGIIPNDRWKDPYMPLEELKREIDSGIVFYGWMEEDSVVGVMGIQRVKDTTLIRHSYILTDYQRKGIGGELLEYLKVLAGTPEILVGTWKTATWAIRFYKKHGFQLVSTEEKDNLLREYWDIPERQIETSVVLRYNKK